MHSTVKAFEASTLESVAAADTPPTLLVTTLYDLIVALQDAVVPDADHLVVATVAHLLRTGQITRRRDDAARAWR